MKINIIDSQDIERIDTEKIRLITEKILALLSKKDFSCNIALVDDKHIEKLNFRFRKVNTPTDVLAFSTRDIAISVETALENAKRFGSSPYEELILYIIHGILHLSGYDDISRSERSRMERKQSQILAQVKKGFEL